MRMKSRSNECELIFGGMVEEIKMGGLNGR